MNNLIEKIVKYEWIVFFAFTILNLLPAIQVPFFPSLDGPAHLYNANIIHQLISSNSEPLKEFYTFNSEIVPNWGGHFVLTLLYSFFSGSMVNKIFIFICLFFLPLSFRFCVKKINKEAIFTTYLIFPFTYTFMFCMGFYNFYIGLIILFLSIGVLTIYRENEIKLKYLIVLFILVSLSYLSHLFVFLSLGMYMFFSTSIDLVQAFSKKENIKQLIKKNMYLLAVSFIPLCLTINYFLHPHGNNDKVYLLKTELLQWITNCRSIICYSVEADVLFSTYVFLVIMVLFAIALFLRGKEMTDIPKNDQSLVSSFIAKFNAHDSFFVIAAIFVFLYFRLPDSDSSAGFISTRLNLMLFLFLIIWISKFNFPKWISFLGFMIIFYSNYKLLKGHAEVFGNLNNEITEIMQIEAEVKENTIVLPLNYSDNWLTQHNSNYLGVNKAVVILDNYECNNTYFPLSWNCNPDMLELARAWKNRFDEILIKTKKETLNRVNYIFIQNAKDFPDSLKTKIAENFFLKKETENYALFEKK